MRKLTWKPDKPDVRDFKFEAVKPSTAAKVDLRSIYNSIYDQGNLGSCTANAISMAFDFERIKQRLNPITPSRLFIYYNERLLEGTVFSDSGAYIRDGIKTINKQGVCPEFEWPYIINKFRNTPTSQCYKDALGNTLKSYLRIDNTKLSDLKSCLNSGYPFVFGFLVYSSFFSNTTTTTGQVSMPTQFDQLLGGHAVICLGYDDSIQKFICRNSWGSSWGDHGHFYIPYTYLTNPSLASDFWTMRLV